jgi:glutamine amidotransferase
MTGIVDYNAGNIKSVEHALESLKAPFVLSKNPLDLEKCDRIIFPGVGDAAYAMQQLKFTGFDVFLKNWAASGKPLIGVCLGSQIIFEHSEEGDTECLGLLKGTIRHFSKIWAERNPDKAEHEQLAMLHNTLKVPHMGWNNITFCNGSSKLLAGVPDESNFYFVHSYVIQPKDPTIIKAYADYGAMVPAVVEKDNITAFQFHPEKSGECGMQILRNFVAADLSASKKYGGASC